MYTGSLLGAKCSRGVLLTAYLFLEPRLRISRALQVLRYGFMAWAGTTFFFPFAMNDATSGNTVNCLIIF
jgi:hypothetical protein